MKRNQGFTLIEVMIVVVIVAILAAVAIPSYQNSIQKTRRADAKEALTRVAASEERYFFTNNEYTAVGTSVGLPSNGESTDGHYTIKIYTTAGTGTDKCGTAPCFRAVATPVLGGSQQKDTQCRTFSLTHTGKKTAQDSNDAFTTDECW